MGVSVVYHHDHVAHWELQLTATAQYHERLLYHMIWEKIKIQSSFYSMCITFSLSVSQGQTVVP